MSLALGYMDRGLAFVVSAPAGTGKTTLVKKLMAEFPEIIASLSYTTRKPRRQEEQGRDYTFVSNEEFDARAASGDFLEYVDLYGVKYGTSREWVENRLNQGKHVILVIDTQGMLQLKEKYPSISIFIRPPSIEELKRRLAQRGTETKEKMETRLEWAKTELTKANYYDYQVINDDLEIAYQVLRSIIIAECHKTAHWQGSEI